MVLSHTITKTFDLLKKNLKRKYVVDLTLKVPSSADPVSYFSIANPISSHS